MKSLLALLLPFAASLHAVEPLALMPHVEDYTLMHWAEGFPEAVPGAPWRRVIQTGRYAMALDTETLQVPNLGALKPGLPFLEAVHAGNEGWQALPHATLTMQMIVEGKTYRCTSGGRWSQFGGPRLIESGQFMQRADVTGLTFAADDGAKLNVEARFETVAWPDRLAMVLAARPGLSHFPAGEPCFGRVGGGFGLDGTNHLEVPHAPELDTPKFTLELWAFVPVDCQVSPRTFPWLVCKNHHEQAQGNYGIVLLNGKPQARLNIGGGRENQFTADSSKPVLTDHWNHLAMSYDGDKLRLYLNGELTGERKIGRTRVPGRDGLAFGRRQDNSGDGYHFRGAIDEVRYYDQALSLEQVRARHARPELELPTLKPVRQLSFASDGLASMVRPGLAWKEAAMEMQLATAKGELKQRWTLPKGESWGLGQWQEVGIAFDPVSSQTANLPTLKVTASEVPNGKPRAVSYEALRGWHRIDLDGIEPIVPAGGRERQNDAIERVRLVLENTGYAEDVARLLFDKSSGGFRQKIGAAITGLSVMLRNAKGEPSGIPVQLSKNWHNRPEGGVYAGQWLHAFSEVRLPARSKVELELTLNYGHWGGVAAASHAQLCLIGWGSNQLWEQSALGSWGESICYEPDQAQAHCLITDVRPAMVLGMNNGPWQWTHNVGGGDAFRLFAPDGTRVPHSRMRRACISPGPCLTEVTYAGRIGEGIEHSLTTSLARSDDLTRGIYRLRLDVKANTEFSRFVIFQIGADTYNYTGERKMALGNETGLTREWCTQWGGDVNRTAPMQCEGRVPWVSLHDAVPRKKPGEQGAWANRGLVIREWKARLGGKDAAPWIVERGVAARGNDSSIVDLVPPPDVQQLQAGDYIEATIEHLIMPMSADDYYGPNEALRDALKTGANTWRMIHREASANQRRVEMKIGTLIRLHPDVAVQTAANTAEFTLVGGTGHVPVTFTGLSSPYGRKLIIDGKTFDQSIHGNDFWQTTFDATTRTWSLTYNVPADNEKPRTLSLASATP